MGGAATIGGMRRLPFILPLPVAGALAAACAAPGPAAPKAAPKPAAKPAPKLPMHFNTEGFDLAPGETYPVELYVPSPTGKAFQGKLTYKPSAELRVLPDPRWTGRIPPAGVKTFPKITATRTAGGNQEVTATLTGGGEATLWVRVVSPTIEPIPGHQKLTVKLTNPFQRRPLHGRVIASNPDRFLQDITAREFRIPGGQTGEVVFPLPGAAPAEGETYDFTLTVETYQGFRHKETYPLAFPPQEEKEPLLR